MSRKLFASCLLFSFMLSACVSSQNAKFSFSAKQLSLAQGESMTVNLLLNSGKHTIDAVDCILEFDPESLELTDINPGTIFENYPLLISNNNTGEAKLSAASLDNFFQGEGVYASLTFKALKNGQSYLSYQYTPDSSLDTDVMSQGQDVLGSVAKLKIQVQ